MDNITNQKHMKPERYRDFNLCTKELQVLRVLSWLTQELPLLSLNQFEKKGFGFVTEDNHIVCLGFRNRNLYSIPKSISLLKKLRILDLRGNPLFSNLNIKEEGLDFIDRILIDFTSAFEETKTIFQSRSNSRIVKETKNNLLNKRSRLKPISKNIEWIFFSKEPDYKEKKNTRVKLLCLWCPDRRCEICSTQSTKKNTIEKRNFEIKTKGKYKDLRERLREILEKAKRESCNKKK